MSLEIVPGSVPNDDYFSLWAVPTGNPVSVAILNAITSKRITYSLTPAGYNRTDNQDTVSDERLTLAQLLERPGRKTTTLEVQYVWGDPADVARVVLAEGTALKLVARWAMSNATDPAVGQKVDVLTVLCGKQRKDAPSANGVHTITQKLFITAPVQDDQLLVA